MTSEVFTLSWFMVFAFIMLIAFIANLIIILAILRDKTMHTSTYFYIINVNIADIILVLSCLPERLAAAFASNEGFKLGMFICYLLPFLQQVSMHAALAILLVLTIHRCYPAGVPRFLQGDLIRRQIRNHSQTLCILWAFAIVINLPLFSLTKYEEHSQNVTISDQNGTNYTHCFEQANCFTGVAENWSRVYLVLLLVCTYLITGIFLIVIYGQVIRIILASNKFTKDTTNNILNKNDSYRYPSLNNRNELHRLNISARINERRDVENPHSHSTSSTSNESNRNQQHQNSPNHALTIGTTVGPNELNKSSPNHHSTQHIQVIVMLFIVIILYILLLLPYRLFNLLYIVHNKLFHQTSMNEILFECLINIVRLLVFLNCALQPIIYLVISSRLRQTVIKLLQSWYKCYCYCRFSLPSCCKRHDYRNDDQVIRTYSIKQYQYQNNRQTPGFYRETRPLQTSLNNGNLGSGHVLIVNHGSQRQLSLSHPAVKARYAVSFTNGQRK